VLSVLCFWIHSVTSIGRKGHEALLVPRVNTEIIPQNYLFVNHSMLWGSFGENTTLSEREQKARITIFPICSQNFP
jgi:hypothetical protein